MTERSDIVERADSLMRRRRSFVATSAATADHASTPMTGDDDDLPVLTEVVPEGGTVEPVTEHRSAPLDEAQVSLLASEITHAIEQQLAFELPTLIEASLISASEELRAGITSTIEAAIGDYVARRKQLRLPLGEPGTEP